MSFVGSFIKRKGINMKRTLITMAAILGLGLGVCAPAFAENIAVVDVTKVVSASKQVQALKAEQQKKNQELRKWLDVVRADIAKQSSDVNKQKLTKKYDETLAKKKEDIQKDYAKKLSEIDKSITATITDYAKSKGYTMVITKADVIYGGVDITADVEKLVK